MSSFISVFHSTDSDIGLPCHLLLPRLRGMECLFLLVASPTAAFGPAPFRLFENRHQAAALLLSVFSVSPVPSHCPSLSLLSLSWLLPVDHKQTLIFPRLKTGKISPSPPLLSLHPVPSPLPSLSSHGIQSLSFCSQSCSGHGLPHTCPLNIL